MHKQCEKCLANRVMCQYCIYNKKDVVIEEKDYEHTIYYNNIPHDNKSKKVCPICHQIYTDYPATSRKDNKTKICTECSRNEALENVEEIFEELGLSDEEIEDLLIQTVEENSKLNTTKD